MKCSFARFSALLATLAACGMPSPSDAPLATSAALAAASAPLAPATLRVGVTRAQVTVDATGQVQVAIPLTLPDAGNGLVPSVSLSYYSGAEAFGPLGYGWSIAPASSIRRCPPSAAVDGHDAGLGFDDGDRACLDGQRLVLASGAAYFADGSTYRLERDDATLVRFARASAADPGRFTVLRKGGAMQSFGADAASRQVHTPSGQAIEWKLAELRDRSDNVVRFAYEHDEGERDVRLASIAYGGNDAAGLAAYRRVELRWTDAANPVTTYMAGQALVRGKRLERVDLLADTAVVHSYHLAYAALASGAGERLTDVQECFADATCYAPTHFEYAADALVLDTDRKLGTTYRPADSDLRSLTLRRLIDVDSDGFDDVVTFNRAEIVVERGDGHGGFAAPVVRAAGLPRTWSQRHNPAFFYDLDADGRVDLLTSVTRTLAGQVTTEQTGLYVLWGTGDGFAPAAQVSRELGAGTEAQRLYMTLADADRDGRPDLFAFTDAGLRVFTLRARRFEAAGALWPFFTLAQGWRFSTHPREVADVNGDGFPDLVGYGDRAIEVALGHGFGFDAPVAWTNELTATGSAQSYGTENHIRLLADANGDGLPDLIGFHQAGVYVALDTGRGFAPAQLWLDDLGVVQGWTSASQLRTVTDVNGDGWLDFVGISPSRVRVVLGHGGPLGQVASLPSGRVVEVATSAQGFRQWQRALYQLDVADLDADGLTDLVCFLPEGLWSLANRTRRLRLTAVEDGYGARTEIGYRVGNTPDVYRRTRELDYPLVTLPSMGLVVASLTERVGAAGAPHTLTYRYENGVVQRTGLGFLGFESWTTRDDASGTEHLVRFGLDAAAGTAGLPLVDEVARVGAGAARTLLSRTESTWESRVLPGSPAHRFTFPRRTVTTGYDEAGAPLSTTVVDQAYDAALDLTSTATTVSDSFGTQTVTAVQRYDAEDPANDLVGLVTSSTVTSSRPGLPSVTHVATFRYDARGRLVGQVREPGTPFEVRTENDYTASPFGLIGTTTRVFTADGAAGLPASRTVASVTYDARGYLLRTTNPLGYSETLEERDAEGRVHATRDANGLVTRLAYDADGTLVESLLPDGTRNRVVLARCAADCPPGAVLRATHQRTGVPDEVVYQDARGRTVRSESVGLDGAPVYVDREYTFDGQLARESTPYRAGSAPLWITYHLDALRRLDRVDRPDGTSERIERAGASSTRFDANGHGRTSVVDAQGLLRRATDAHGVTLGYEYDAANQLTAIVDPAGRRTEMTYDLAGRRTRLVDPTLGTQTTRYNALDLAVESVDATGQVTQLAYDLAGRLRESRAHAGAADEELSTWEYDTAAHGVGQLAAVGNGTITRRFAYDALGRPTTTDVTLAGRSYRFAQTYDALGRSATVTYPSGLVVASVYDDLGHLRGTKDAATGRAFQVVEDAYPWGAPRRVRLGNGLTTELTVDAASQRLTAARTLDGNGSAVVDQRFGYDAAGNLTARSEARTGESETFAYDALDRLTRASRRGAIDVTVSYDALGNIVERSDVGRYGYGEACDGVTPGPFAVTSAGGRAYCYDALGRLRRGNGRQVDFGASGQPTRIARDGGAQVELRYGPTGDRVLETDRDARGALTTVRTPVNGFEDLDGPDGHEWRHHLAGGVTVVTSDRGQAERYDHLDSLGSVVAVSDGSGRIVERYRFDPWGKRTTVLGGTDARFGYTGHLELADVGLVHMGGRVYDPEIGRFLSPDPFVQDESDPQSLNRYSYVLNNPLSATDPSGFISLRSIGKSISRGLGSLAKGLANPGHTLVGQVQRLGKWVGNPQNLRLVASIAVAVVAAYLAPYAAGQIASTWGSWAAGAAISGAGGYASGYIASDGNLDYARRSALTSMAFFCIGQYYQGVKLTTTDKVVKAIAHGVVGGASSAANGGSFESGFAANLVSEAITLGHGYDAAADAIGVSADSAVYSAVSSAIVGGTTAELTGGRFEDAALSSALGALFNDRLHRMVTKENGDVIEQVVDRDKHGKETLVSARLVEEGGIDGNLLPFCSDRTAGLVALGVVAGTYVWEFAGTFFASEAELLTAEFDPGRAGHIFRLSRGHVNPQTGNSMANFAKLFEDVASNPANYRADAVEAGIITRYAADMGVTAYTWSARAGQIWVSVRNGMIQNAGVNRLGAIK